MYYSATVVSLLVVLSVAAPNAKVAERATPEWECKLFERLGHTAAEPSDCAGNTGNAGNVTYLPIPGNFTTFTNWTDVAFPKPEDCNALGSSAVQRACDELVLLQPKVAADKGIWHWFRWYGCTVGYMIPPTASGANITMDQCRNQTFQPMIDYAINDGITPHPSYSVNLLTHPQKDRVQGTVVNATSVAFMVTGQQQTCDRCS